MQNCTNQEKSEKETASSTNSSIRNSIFTKINYWLQVGPWGLSQTANLRYFLFPDSYLYISSKKKKASYIYK